MNTQTSHRWTETERKQVLREFITGTKQKDIAEKWNLTRSAVSSMISQYVKKNNLDKEKLKQTRLRKRVNRIRKIGEKVDFSKMDIKKIENGKWTYKDRVMADKLWKLGAKYDEIAQLMGVTKGVVAGKIRSIRMAKKQKKVFIRRHNTANTINELRKSRFEFNPDPQERRRLWETTPKDASNDYGKKNEKTPQKKRDYNKKPRLQDLEKTLGLSGCTISKVIKGKKVKFRTKKKVVDYLRSIQYPGFEVKAKSVRENSVPSTTGATNLVFNDIGFDTLPKFPVPERFENITPNDNTINLTRQNTTRQNTTQLTHTVSFRVTEELFTKIMADCDRLDISVTEWVMRKISSANLARLEANGVQS